MAESIENLKKRFDAAFSQIEAIGTEYQEVKSVADLKKECSELQEKLRQKQSALDEQVAETHKALENANELQLRLDSAKTALAEAQRNSGSADSGEGADFEKFVDVVDRRIAGLSRQLAAVRDDIESAVVSGIGVQSDSSARISPDSGESARKFEWLRRQRESDLKQLNAILDDLNPLVEVEGRGHA